MNKKDITIIIVSLIIIILGTFFYFKKSSVPVPAQNTQTTQAPSTPPSTFAQTAFSGFPKELAPTGGSAPQYFNNTLATGAIFAIKKSVAQTESDYEKQLKTTDWVVLNKVLDKNQTSVTLSDKKTLQTANIKINFISATQSAMIISINKQ